MLVGIDLGTTNSLISYWQDDKATLIPNSLGELLTPSVVGLDDSGSVIVGTAAKHRLITHPKLTVANFKRYMGTNHEVTLGKQTFRPEDLSALVLRALKEDAEAFLGERITEAIITVPAYFNDTQRKATKAAGQIAGLKVERLLNEPTAAALAYGIHQQDDDQKYLVFDLGGGTFDVSIVEMFDQVMEVHASAGDNFLGGEDFKDQIVKSILTSHKEELDIDPKSPPEGLLDRLSRQAEIAKCNLSSNNSTALKLTWNEREFQWPLTVSEFENVCEPLINRLTLPIQRALRDAKLKVSDLDAIVLVGGATRMPMVRKLVTKLFGRFPMIELDPDQVIAMGAGIQAALKARNEALGDVVMTDVCPYTLGIETSHQLGNNQYDHGVYAPIIERNNYIPISREQRFFTLDENQTYINVKVYQGEHPRVKDNIFIGELNVNVPKNAAGEEAIDVRFTYDLNGLLEVEVTVVSTQNKNRIVIEENPGVLNKDEIEARFKALSNLKMHPRDDLVNKQLVNRAERLYSEYLGDVRAAISHELSLFNACLEKQDTREIPEARDRLSNFLDQLEHLR